MRPRQRASGMDERRKTRGLRSFACLAWLASLLLASHSVLPAPRHSPSHQIHVSVTQIEFDRAEQVVEIAIRVFADDLENALGRHAKRQVKIDSAKADKDQELGEIATGYVQRNFELKTKLGKPVKLEWVGIEGQQGMFWLYLKGKMQGGLEGAQLRNRIFCEIYDDQVNLVNTKYQGKQIGLMFEQKDGIRIITQPAPNPPKN